MHVALVALSYRKPPDRNTRAVTSASASSSFVPEKMPRVTSTNNNEEPVTSPPVLQTRKRTSSGVFQVDEAEPPSKKPEHIRSNSDGALQILQNTNTVTNGRRKVTETTESWDETKERKDTEIEGKKTKIDRIITVKERKRDIDIKVFDSEAKSKCVEAFKESDSWD